MSYDLPTQSGRDITKTNIAKFEAIEISQTKGEFYGKVNTKKDQS